MNKGCPKCGRMIDQNYKICPYCNYNFKEIDNFFQNIEEEKYIEDEKYAGFIKRMIAGIIDIYITLLLSLPLFIKIYKKTANENIWMFIIISSTIYIIYSSLLERTKLRGSLGKQVTKIEVTDEYENSVTLGKAFIRNISKIFNVLTLGIGFLTCACPPYKQTLGDRISKTYVLNKIKFKEEKIIKVSSVSKRVIAFVIDIIYITVLIAIEYYIITYISNMINFSQKLINYKEMLYKMVAIIIIVLYFPYNESKRGKTKGKELLKIRVTNLEEEKISFILALFRYILILLDIITLGFFLPLANTKKQTLKDIITKTIIIDD